MTKTTQSFLIGDELPAKSKFVCNVIDKGVHKLIYEVTLKSIKELTPEQKEKENLIQELIKRTISYLNKVTKSNFKHTAQSAQKKIRARLNEGAKPINFKEAIDNMSHEWLDNPAMQRHLNPETLFGPKFWKYTKKSEQDSKVQDVFNMMDNIQKELEE